MRLFRFMLAAMALSATQAFSQGIGLQLADTTFRDEQESSFGVAGFAIGDDISFAGIRGTYSLLNEFKVFADIGLVHADLLEETDAGMGLAVGFLVDLPMDKYVDTSLRATYYRNAFMNEVDIDGVSAMLTTSWDIPGIREAAFFGGLGVINDNVSVDIDDGSSTHDNDFEFAYAVGLSWILSDDFTIYFEYDDADSSRWGISIARLY